MTRFAEVPRIGAAVGGVLALLGVAALATMLIVGVVQDNGRLRQQVATLGKRPPISRTVTATPSAASTSPAVGGSPGTPGRPGTAVQPVAATGGGSEGGAQPSGGANPAPSGPSAPDTGPSTGPGGPPSSPPPSTQPPVATGCSSNYVISATLPLGVLPCNTLAVARVARAGGTSGAH